jgi:hypothetical protein
MNISWLLQLRTKRWRIATNYAVTYDCFLARLAPRSETETVIKVARLAPREKQTGAKRLSELGAALAAPIK